MKVELEELKSILKSADAIGELLPGRNYIINYQRGSMPAASLHRLLQVLKAQGINGVVVLGELKIYEVKP